MTGLPKVINDNMLAKMWDEFGDVPINKSDETEEAFYIWESGTDRFEIWKWFDVNHTLGVAKGLMDL